MGADRFVHDPATRGPEELRPLLELGTSVITDAMARLGAMHGGHWLHPGRTMVGYARTVVALQGNASWFCRAVDATVSGEVLVIDTGGAGSVSVHGGLSNTALVRAGACGVVVDGGIRDVAELRSTGLPCYYRHISPGMGNPDGDGAMGVPVAAFGQAVREGDVIVGDDDGVVVVPRGRWRDVIDAGRERVLREQAVAARLRRGGSLLASPPAEEGS
ncbi:RraA family protein [Nocardioides alcanivorans]|uniref:RraA family protein n=1 Tax=Nocardioides alcanivorans TaxID=2897352 RepID=UPI001F3FE2C6|nr:hypothetical protein [Nocardioides alcanivorans]